MSAAARVPADTVDPGKVLGIVGLVLSFVPSGLPGLVVSAIARRRSSKAGFRNTPALIGLILGIVATVLHVAVIAVLATAALASVTYSSD